MKIKFWGQNTRSLLRLLLLITFVSTTTPLQAQTKDATQVGTWENKDEDGDGVLDEHDDYPFDPTKSSYPLIKEKEFNNNPWKANDAGKLPFIVTGSFELDIDNDDYKFEVSQEDIDSRTPFHFIVLSENSTLSPRLGVLNSNGKAELVDATGGNLENVGLIKNSRLFFPKKVGTYYLTVGNRNEKADASLTYKILAFKDTDMDGIPDDKEQALGSNYEIQDTDSDNIFDGNEFLIHQNITTVIADIDSDGIPNWLDKDSDNDGILDVYEGLSNEDSDILPSFVDTDSDNNGVKDKDDIVNQNIRKDSDNDGTPDYQDIDDDGDGVINTYDKNDKSRYSFNKTTQLYNVTTTTEGLSLTNRVKPAHWTKLHFSGNLSDDVILVLSKSGSQSSMKNLKLNTANATAGTIEFMVPNYQKIDLGGNKVEAFLISEGKRTNRIYLTLIHHKAPLLRDTDVDLHSIGEQVILEGVNFRGDLKVTLNDFEIRPDVHSSKNVSFTLPKRTKTGLLSISNEYGTSNGIDFTVGETIKITTDIPVHMLNIDGVISIGHEEFSNIKDIEHTSIAIQRKTYNRLRIYSQSEQRSLLYAFITENDTSVTIDLNSTAKAIVFNGFIERYPLSTYSRLQTFLSSNTEFEHFKTYVKQGLESDLAFLSARNDALYKKVWAIQSLMRNEVRYRPKKQKR